jgi:hypothetical protein
MAKIKVLVFAASPPGTAPLDLAREFREIDEEVRQGTHRTAVELILVPGARPVDLLRKVNENQIPDRRKPQRLKRLGLPYDEARCRLRDACTS